MYTNFHMRVWPRLDYRLKVENESSLSLTQKLNTTTITYIVSFQCGLGVAYSVKKNYIFLM